MPGTIIMYLLSIQCSFSFQQWFPKILSKILSSCQVSMPHIFILTMHKQFVRLFAGVSCYFVQKISISLLCIQYVWLYNRFTFNRYAFHSFVHAYRLMQQAQSRSITFFFPIGLIIFITIHQMYRFFNRAQPAHTQQHAFRDSFQLYSFHHTAFLYFIFLFCTFHKTKTKWKTL